MSDIDMLIQRIRDRNAGDQTRMAAIEALVTTADVRTVDQFLRTHGGEQWEGGWLRIRDKVIEEIVRVWEAPTIKAAIQHLATSADVESLGTILWRSRSGDVRKASIETLATIGNAAAVEHLIALVISSNEKSGDIKQAALEALIKIGNSGAVMALSKAIQKCSSGSGLGVPADAIIGALVRIGNAQAVEPIIEALHCDDQLARIAHHGLIKLGPIAVEPLVRRLLAYPTYPWIHLTPLVAIGKPSVVPLIGALQSSDTELRRQIAVALGEIDDVRAIEPLIEVFQRSRHQPKEAAGIAKVLGHFGDKGAVDSIISFLTWLPGEISANDLFRGMSADRRDLWRGKESLLAWECLNTELLTSLVDALVSIGTAEAAQAVQPIVVMLDALANYSQLPPEYRTESGTDWQECVRNAAKKILRCYYYCSSSDAVSNHLLNANPEFRKIAIEAVSPANATALMPSKPHDMQTVKCIINALSDPDYSVRAAAAQALGWLRHYSAVEPLFETLQDRDQALRNYAAQALLRISDSSAAEPLAMAVPDLEYGVRCEVVGALQKLGGTRTIPALVALMYASYASGSAQRAWKDSLERFVAGNLFKSEDHNSVLPKIVLDWIFVYSCGVVHERRHLPRSVGKAVGLEGDLLDLAHQALGPSGTEAILELCSRKDIWSSAILYRVGNKPDGTRDVHDWGQDFTEVISYSEDRLIASRELNSRGFTGIDPAIHITVG
jgi:HEAT repeat protein